MAYFSCSVAYIESHPEHDNSTTMNLKEPCSGVHDLPSPAGVALELVGPRCLAI